MAPDSTVFPSLQKEGWLRHPEMIAKHPLNGADGVVRV